MKYWEHYHVWDNYIYFEIKYFRYFFVTSQRQNDHLMQYFQQDHFLIAESKQMAPCHETSDCRVHEWAIRRTPHQLAREAQCRQARTWPLPRTSCRKFSLSTHPVRAPRLSSSSSAVPTRTCTRRVRGRASAPPPRRWSSRRHRSRRCRPTCPACPAETCRPCSRPSRRSTIPFPQTGSSDRSVPRTAHSSRTSRRWAAVCPTVQRPTHSSVSEG